MTPERKALLNYVPNGKIELISENLIIRPLRAHRCVMLFKTRDRYCVRVLRQYICKFYWIGYLYDDDDELLCFGPLEKVTIYSISIRASTLYLSRLKTTIDYLVSIWIRAYQLAMSDLLPYRKIRSAISIGQECKRFLYLRLIAEYSYHH